MLHQTTRVLVAVVVFASVVGAAPPSRSLADPDDVVLLRGEAAEEVAFTTEEPGEALLHVRASANASWAQKGSESAIVGISVDGERATDLLLFSDRHIQRTVALGHLDAGDHTLRMHLRSASPEGVDRASISQMSVEIVPVTEGDKAIALRHAPILYGRTLPSLGTRFQNAITDAPLIAYHELLPAETPGHRTLTYTVVWSNEDGGTDTAALMARWGRTTDIELVYSVEVDADGNTVPGTATYQAPDHEIKEFDGDYDGTHPILQTCTSNNLMCDDDIASPLRFFLAADETKRPQRAREVVMERHPWTYQVMAFELVREDKIESPSTPGTPLTGDQRNYVYIEVDKDTVSPPNPEDGPQVAVALGVRLAGSRRIYRSNHGIPDWAIERDDPAATTVELPQGTGAEDIAEIIAYRVPVGGDTGAKVVVRDIERAFFLNSSYLPQKSFVSWKGKTTLTRSDPSNVLWERLPLGPRGMRQSETEDLLVPGLTYTKIVRGQESGSERFVVDVAFVATRSEAQDLIDQLREDGMRGRIREVDKRAPDDPMEDPFGYLVRTGHPQDMAEAEVLAAALVSMGYPNARAIYTGEDGTPTTGPYVVHVIELDPDLFRGTIRPILGTDIVPGLERLTDISERTGAVAAVNGGYFVIEPVDGTSGDLAGISMIEGELVSESVGLRTGLVLPFDNIAGARVSMLSTVVTAFSSDGAARRVDGLNRAPGLIRGCGGVGGDEPTLDPKHDVTCTDDSELISYSERFGDTSPTGPGFEVVLDPEGVVLERRPKRGGAIPGDGAVLAGTRGAASWLRAHARIGSNVDVRARVEANGAPLAPTARAGIVNGGPRLVDNGATAIDAVAEGFHHPENPSFYYAFGVRRNPRTLAGETPGGRVLLVAVDGRKPGYSVGASFVEEARIMKALGAEDAVNLDGGGSTTMTVEGDLVTVPSDTTGERTIGDAIVIER